MLTNETLTLLGTGEAYAVLRMSKSKTRNYSLF
jgi:hypothetical protein